MIKVSTAVQMYDLVAGTQGLTLSRFVSSSEARRQFPTLSPIREDGKTLKGTVRKELNPVLLFCLIGMIHGVRPRIFCHGDNTEAAQTRLEARVSLLNMEECLIEQIYEPGRLLCL